MCAVKPTNISTLMLTDRCLSLEWGGKRKGGSEEMSAAGEGVGGRGTSSPNEERRRTEQGRVNEGIIVFSSAQHTHNLPLHNPPNPLPSHPSPPPPRKMGDIQKDRQTEGEGGGRRESGYTETLASGDVNKNEIFRHCTVPTWPPHPPTPTPPPPTLRFTLF